MLAKHNKQHLIWLRTSDNIIDLTADFSKLNLEHANMATAMLGIFPSQNC